MWKKIFANNNVAFAIKRLQCPNQCGNSLDNMTTTPGVKRGVCVDGLCHCYTGFSGVDCSEGHGPKNRHTFPVKDNAVLKILEEDDTTCDSTTCFSLCSYGGSCTSKFTCKCFNKFMSIFQINVNISLNLCQIPPWRGGLPPWGLAGILSAPVQKFRLYIDI